MVSGTFIGTPSLEAPKKSAARLPDSTLACMSETVPFRTEVQGHVRILGITPFVHRLQFGHPFRTHYERSMSRTFAYARVSTTDQTPTNQLREIEAAGFTVDKRRVVTESISGSVSANQRPGFAELLLKMEEGDVLIVTKLDRLGRNAIDVRATVEALADRGIRIHCLALGGVDLTSAAGRMTMQVLNAVAEFERDLLIERTQAGIARAKAEGKAMGRPSALTNQQQSEVRKLLNDGATVAGIAKQYGTSRQTIMRIRNTS